MSQAYNYKILGINLCYHVELETNLFLFDQNQHFMGFSNIYIVQF